MDVETLRRAAKQYLRHREGLAGLALTITGHVPSQTARMAAYHAAGMQVDDGVVIYGGLEVRCPRGVTIGKGSVIGHRAVLDGRRGLLIGRHVNLSHEVWIWTLQHDPQAPDFGVKGGPVTVCDHVWLSARVQVLPSVTIGEGAVVAAGAVVTRDVDPYSIVAGIPARPIGTRQRNLDYSPALYPFIPFI